MLELEIFFLFIFSYSASKRGKVIYQHEMPFNVSNLLWIDLFVEKSSSRKLWTVSCWWTLAVLKVYFKLKERQSCGNRYFPISIKSSLQLLYNEKFLNFRYILTTLFYKQKTVQLSNFSYSWNSWWSIRYY